MKNSQLVRIADRVINCPLAIMPEKLALIADVLGGRFGLDTSELKLPPETVEALSINNEAAHMGVGTFEKDATGRRKPYRQTPDGTAIIPVQGSLVNRGSFLDAMSGIASYDSIKDMLRLATDDPEISSIVLDIDSPGGEAVGAFETGDAVAAAAQKKRVVAVANGLCCSAAYGIAVGADEIVVSPSSITGSVGVVMLHLDQSARVHNAGVVPTIIQAGSRKTDGNPLKSLTPDAATELKSEVDAFMDLFVSSVAKGRPGLSEEAIRATEARTYLGAKAVEMGLADKVGSFDSVISELSRPGLRRATKATGARSMKTEANEITQEAHDAAVKQAHTAGHAEGVKAGTAAGATAERERISGILNCEEGKKRPKQALALAMTGATLEQATAMLAVAAEEPAPGVAATTVPPAGRSKDAPGGLATVDGAPKTGADAQHQTAEKSDFEKGVEMAKLAGVGVK